MHLNLKYSVSGTRLSSSAFDIETESALLIAFGLGIGGSRKKITYQVKYSGISSGVGSGSPSDGRLVYVVDFVQLFHTFDTLVSAGNAAGTVQFSRQMLVEDLIHQ